MQQAVTDEFGLRSPWLMRELPPLSIGLDMSVVVDCQGKSFNYHSKYGNLTVGTGSSIQYVNCDLLEYEFPDHAGLYGTIHIITDCWVGMTSCTVCSPASCNNRSVLLLRCAYGALHSCRVAVRQ